MIAPPAITSEPPRTMGNVGRARKARKFPAPVPIWRSCPAAGWCLPTPIPAIGTDIRLTAEVRGEFAAVSISDGQRSYTSAIARVTNTSAGSSGLKHEGEDQQFFADFELRKSPTLVKDDHLERKLYDAKGIYKGEMKGHGLPAQRGLGDSDWDSYGREKDILLDAWRPSRLPTSQDWLLVLEHQDQ